MNASDFWMSLTRSKYNQNEKRKIFFSDLNYLLIQQRIRIELQN